MMFLMVLMMFFRFVLVGLLCFLFRFLFTLDEIVSTGDLLTILEESLAIFSMDETIGHNIQFMFFMKLLLLLLFSFIDCLLSCCNIVFAWLFFLHSFDIDIHGNSSIRALSMSNFFIDGFARLFRLSLFGSGLLDSGLLDSSLLNSGFLNSSLFLLLRFLITLRHSGPCLFVLFFDFAVIVNLWLWFSLHNTVFLSI